MYKGRGMDTNLDPERIEEITENSIPFPLFTNNGIEGDERILHAIYVDELGPSSPLMMPSYITLVREGADGWSTIGHYELIETVKEHSNPDADKLN